jgi:hypothetical protein
MTSIFETALDDDFARLSPMMQKRFGVGLGSGYACVGTGVMTRIRRGPWWVVPFLHIGKLRNILIPDVGENVPFTISNYPYVDPFGRETVTFVREYRLRHKPSRFDATMILHDGRVIDYLGTHQHLAVDLDLAVGDDGSLSLTSGAQRFYEGPRVGFRFPMIFSGRARLHESFDDTAGVYRIRMEIHNPVFGFLFGYDGEFTCEFVPATDAPERLKPVRHESRT